MVVMGNEILAAGDRKRAGYCLKSFHRNICSKTIKFYVRQEIYSERKKNPFFLFQKNTKDDQSEFTLTVSDGEDLITLANLWHPLVRCNILISSHSVTDGTLNNYSARIYCFVVEFLFVTLFLCNVICNCFLLL